MMSLDCNQCQSVIFAPAKEDRLYNFQAKIHTDIASLKRCAVERACHLCIVLHGILKNRMKFGPIGRQPPESDELDKCISLWLYYEGDEEESDDWEYIEDESATQEDTPRNIIFRHPLGTDDLCIRNGHVIAKSEWDNEPSISHPADNPTKRALSDDGSSSLDLSTGSDASMHLAKSWIRVCRDTHESCRKASEDVPVRLLDVSKVEDSSTGAIHLVNSQSLGQVPYVTLSHRWNPSYKYSTTSSNFEAHLEHGVDISHLPKTLAEACVTTQRLGFDYIWIDTLCIIQDSEEDKISEIPKMAVYYQNAELNLSASTESIGGLWSDRDGASTKPFVLDAILELPRRSKSVTLELAPVLRADKSHLDYRGWILQERIFPRRTLFFDAYWLSFECGEMSASESCPHGVRHTVSSNRTTVENDLATKLQRDCNLSIIGGLIRAMDSTTGSENRQQTLTLWYRILNDYSLRQLSFEADRLNAISGLAERLSILLKDDYIGGMWKSSLIECLQWRPDDPIRGSEAIRQTQYRAPTWSWASCELLPRSSYRDSRHSLPLQFSNDYVNGTESSAVVEILDVQWRCESLNSFGNLSWASLKIRGRPLRGFAYTARAPDMDLKLRTLTEKIEQAPSRKLTSTGGSTGDRALIWLHISGVAEADEEVKIVTMVSPDTSDQKVVGFVYLLPLAERWLPSSGDSLFCLVLKQTTQGKFERIGHSVTQSSYMVEVAARSMELI